MKMQKLPLFSCMLLRNEGKTDQVKAARGGGGAGAGNDSGSSSPRSNSRRQLSLQAKTLEDQVRSEVDVLWSP